MAGSSSAVAESDRPATAAAATAWDRPVAGADAHFRPDVEGLRAVAVVAVLLYHMRLPLFPGGFVGVDVFFVISGFLITGLLLRELAGTGRVDFVAFYARRARRLLPMALLVIVATVALAALVLSPIELRDVAGDAAAAALYVSNYWFAAQSTDYLAGDRAVLPLLHYWSLGVEEQFYLVWPLLLLAGWRLGRGGAIAAVLVATFAGSLALSVVVTDISAPWAFFSLPTRAWQLALGGLIAVGVIRLPGRAPAWIGSAAGLAGMAMVAVAVVYLGETVAYPGAIALLPAVGAALLIVSGERPGSLVNAALATAVPRWIGRISYSLYLWHWPLLMLLPLALDRFGLGTRIALAGLAVVLAAASTRVIERPFRSLPLTGRRARRALALGLAASVVVASGAVAGGELAVQRLPRSLPSSTIALTPWRTTGPLPDGLRPSLIDAGDDVAASIRDGCQVAYAGVEPRRCVYGHEAARRTVVLIGDSHAAQWQPAIESIAEYRGWRVIVMTKGSCPPVRVTVWLGLASRGYAECDAWLEAAIADVTQLHPQVVFVAFSRAYSVMVGGRAEPLADQLTAWRAGAASVLAALRAAAGQVVFIADTPRHLTNPLNCLARQLRLDACPGRRAELVDQAYLALERDLAAEAGAAFVSSPDLLCDATACPLVMGNVLVYRDTNHVTATLARELAPAIDAVLR
jgi:peptidoglycan/LPS O-acetylase OafA/YrhL